MKKIVAIDLDGTYDFFLFKRSNCGSSKEWNYGSSNIRKKFSKH